jgi:DNA-binding beta-propeller fold protein YncE
MRFNSIFISLIFILLSQTAFAKIYYAEQHLKINKHQIEFYLHQIESEQNFKLIQSKKIGIGKKFMQFYSDSGKYLVTYIVRKKGLDEVTIYNSKDFKKISKIDVELTSSQGKMSYSKPLFSNDESQILIQSKNAKNKNSINSFSVLTGALTYSVPLKKKENLHNKTHSGSIFIVSGYIDVSGKTDVYGFPSLKFYNIVTGAVIKEMNENNAQYKLIDNSGLVTIVKYKYINRDVPSYSLIIIDGKTGKFKLKKKLGMSIPLFKKVKGETEYSIIAFAKKKRNTEVSIFKIINGKLKLVASVPIKTAPTKMIVSNDNKNMLFASQSSMTLVKLDELEKNKRIMSPFDVVNGFFSADNSLVYVREGTGSEVAVIDFVNSKVIKDSSTGRASVKVGIFLGNAAINALNLYLGGGHVPMEISWTDTKMIMDRDNKRLYVVNTKTNDVTFFENQKLKERIVLATGLGTIGVFQYKKEIFPKNEDENVFVIGARSISYFNNSTNDLIHAVEYEELITLDFEDNLFFALDKDKTIKVYKLSTGKIIYSFDKLNIWSNFNYFVGK